MKIYTRKGDRGETSLFSGRRAGKSDLCVAAVGDLDELSASLGLAAIAFPAASAELRRIQHLIYVISALLSAEGERDLATFSTDETRVLEALIDGASADLPELRDFIYPGESEAGSRFHMARAIARRAERSAAALDAPPAPEEVLAFLNRLSDLLFVWARQADAAAGQASELLGLPPRR